MCSSQEVTLERSRSKELEAVGCSWLTCANLISTLLPIHSPGRLAGERASNRHKRQWAYLASLSSCKSYNGIQNMRLERRRNTFLFSYLSQHRYAPAHTELQQLHVLTSLPPLSLLALFSPLLALSPPPSSDRFFTEQRLSNSTQARQPHQF